MARTKAKDAGETPATEGEVMVGQLGQGRVIGRHPKRADLVFVEYTQPDGKRRRKYVGEATLTPVAPVAPAAK